MSSFNVTLSDGGTIVSSYVTESGLTAEAILADLNEAAYFNHVTDLYDDWEFTVVAV